MIVKKPKKNKPYQQLRSEIKRIRRLHDVTMYAYQQTSDYINKKIQNKEIFASTEILMSLKNENRILARSPFEIIPKLTNLYPAVMRESLLVSAISQFEIFIADTVWEIAKRSIEPFKQKDKTLEYPQAKVLSYKSIEEMHQEIISAECRHLTSQGFGYARKYYEKRFGIRFSDGPINVAEIEESHERRHILVHRGGYIDSQYQKRFAPQMQIDERLFTSDEYFQKALDNLMKLGEYITGCVDNIYPETFQQEINIPLSKELVEYLEKYVREDTQDRFANERLAYWFKAKFKDKSDIESHLNPLFSFGSTIEKHTLSEIFLTSSMLSENEIEWIVDGSRTVTGLYVSNQLAFARRDRFIEFASKKLIL